MDHIDLSATQLLPGARANRLCNVLAISHASGGAYSGPSTTHSGSQFGEVAVWCSVLISLVVIPVSIVWEYTFVVVVDSY